MGKENVLYNQSKWTKIIHFSIFFANSGCSIPTTSISNINRRRRRQERNMKRCIGITLHTKYLESGLLVYYCSNYWPKGICTTTINYCNTDLQITLRSILFLLVIVVYIFIKLKFKLILDLRSEKVNGLILSIEIFCLFIHGRYQVIS